jgi:hypothetical protein
VFDKREYAASAIPDVFRICFPVASGFHRQHRSCLAKQLVWLFRLCRPRVFSGCTGAHTHQGRLPSGLRILRLLCLGCTSTSCGEVESSFF